ncbi:MAG: protein translocase subunit SecF [Chloroflexia bacterium]|nr:protein translocase subunit SecF [Chloroflexia bacterium]
MLRLMRRRYLYFVISALVIIPGIVAMVISTVRFGSPVRLSIDFTSGSYLEVGLPRPVQADEIRQVFVGQGVDPASIQLTEDDQVAIVRTPVLDVAAKDGLLASLSERFGPVIERRFDSVGPSISQEVTRNALYAVLAAALVILGFITFAFRKVPHPFRYGVCAITAMLHDILVTVGLFALAGLLWGWEADTLFLSALLTVIGFSVQDTIVVYDRIRENIPKLRGQPFEDIVDHSLTQTLHRSLATQLNAMFVMVAILLFGGSTIKQFILVMFVGLASGTYSSIFNAVPLLVVWEKGEWAGIFRRSG